MNHPRRIFASPLGNWILGWSSQGVRLLRPTSEPPDPEPLESPDWVLRTLEDLRLHLGGSARDLTSIPLDDSVFTPFQNRVAEILRATQPGQSLTYGEIAFRAGRPGAARAVGQAIRRNPVLVLVPCHRVVAAGGPGGWSAFGSPGIKERLMELEKPNNGIDAAPLP